MKYPVVLEVDSEMSVSVEAAYLIGDPRRFWNVSREVKQRRKSIVCVNEVTTVSSGGSILMGTLGDGVDHASVIHLGGKEAGLFICQLLAITG